MTQIPSNMTASLSLLSASTGPDGAQAQMTRLDIGDGTYERDPDALRDAMRAKDKAVLERAKDVGRAFEAKDPAARGATLRRISSIKARITDMSKALETLRNAPNLSSGTMVAVRTGQGNDILSILNGGTVDSVYTQGGNDSLAIQSDVVDSIYTGAGSDAVTISADMVDSVYTGATSGRSGNSTEPDDDAVAIQARSIDSVYTGAGRDAVALQADLVDSIYTGDGSDSLSISAGAVRGIHTGNGNDSVTIDAVLGSSQGYGWTRFGMGPAAPVATAPSPVPDSPSPAAPAQGLSPEEAAAMHRLHAAQTNYADVHLGAGNDSLSIRVDEVISVNASSGDDVIAIGGGTVVLHFDAGDGNDRISIAEGATLGIQLEHGTDWSESWDGDTLVLELDGGSMRIKGAAGAAAIGIMEWGSAEPTLLHMTPPLDHAV